MISNSSEREVFVYIILPEETDFITAGRFVLENYPQGPYGRFVYARSYLENPNAVEIDPIELKLTKNTYNTFQHEGIFGALRDAGPDYWGRYVIEKQSERALLNEIDYLLESPDDRAGALGFGLTVKPPLSTHHFNKVMDLKKLIEISETLIQDKNVDSVGDSQRNRIKNLLLIGTSMGGARPKTVVEDHAGLWIAKFNRFDDRWNVARVEYAMLELAQHVGINTSEHRLESIGGQDVLLVKRFDRKKKEKEYTRARMVSALSILRADDTFENRDKWSYILLAEEIRRFSQNPKKDLKELFLRICFNALISNLDDHPRNHAFIAERKNWTLSPAYDLTPSPVIANDRRDLAMICGNYGRFANAKNILTHHGRFLLTQEEATTLLEDITQKIEKSWYDITHKSGVHRSDIELIRPAFVYSGFFI
ncbi:MAG: HipA domain-containing protein [Proteobacteria bacterium]|nr:HipA domain-containing protein [Pseudomonadota bacterium]